MDWDALVAHVHAINRPDRRVVCIVHPDAMGAVDCPKFGGIRSERGAAGYVLSVQVKDRETGFVHHKTERVTL